MLNKLIKKKKSPVTIHKAEDEELSQAYVKARESFFICHFPAKQV